MSAVIVVMQRKPHPDGGYRYLHLDTIGSSRQPAPDVPAVGDLLHVVNAGGVRMTKVIARKWQYPEIGSVTRGIVGPVPTVDLIVELADGPYVDEVDAMGTPRHRG